MSLITTGINIVANGVGKATAQIKSFGQQVAQTGKQVNQFSNHYNQQTKSIHRSSTGLAQGLSQNWSKMYRDAKKATGDQAKALQALEAQYDRTFRNIGNKYQSMVMGSVALSMSGISIMNVGTGTLGFTKTALDQARDFETVMSQIAFYGNKTKDEMAGLQKEIFRMGFDLPVKTTEIANAVLGAQKLGYGNTDEAKIMANEASKIQFMSLGKLDGEESLKYISHLRKLTGTEVKETGKLTDKLVMTADQSASSIDSLWKTIQSSRSAFDNMNTDIDTMLTLSGVMADRLQPRMAGMALSSFSGGIQMAEKAGMENRGTRGEYYNQLTGAMGGKLDSYKGDMIAYIQDVATKSKDLWGNGAERTGKLISIFGRSSIDLFHAIDAYNEGTGKSMLEIREGIQNSTGHAEKLMDVLMNGSYGTEMRLQAMVEQFQILFGQTLRPAFNTILDGITAVIGKINELAQEHPKLFKAIGYFVAFGGIMATVTGGVMMATGAILAIYASLANVMIQLARNIRVVHLLGQGYSTAGQMIKGQFLGPLGTMARGLLKFSGITLFMAMAWKNDFLRMKTTLIEWYDYTKNGLSKAKDMFAKYGAMSAKEWSAYFNAHSNNGGLDNWIAKNGLKLAILADAIGDIWGDGEISADKYHKLNEMGLLGFVEKVYEIKTAVVDFWKGFQAGVGEGLRLLKDMLSPIIPVFTWVRDKIMELLNHFGYFENTTKGITSKWEQWGASVGVLVGSVIAIKVGLWAWVKVIKLVISPFVRIFKLTKGIWNLLSKMKNLKLGQSLASGMGKAFRWLLPKPIRGYVKGKMQHRHKGKYSNIPNAKYHPATTSPTGQPIPAKTTYTKYRSKAGKRRLNKMRNNQPVMITGKNGSNSLQSGRGIGGKLKDFWYGRQYAPEQRTDKRGRKYHQIKTMEGGVMRTKADGTVKGQQVRSGRGLKGFFKGIGHLITNRNSGIVAGGGARQAVNASRGAEFTGGGRRGGFLQGLKGVGSKIGGVAQSLGKGLLKGLGTVVKKGLPLLFKGALRLIPFLGWAIMIWDAVSLIWTNWDAIKNAGSVAWAWIKEKGTQAWNGIKDWGITKWNEISAWAVAKWDTIKTSALGIWDSWMEKAKSIGKSVADYIKGILSFDITIPKMTIFNPMPGDNDWTIGGQSFHVGWKGYRNGLYNVDKENHPAMLHKGEMVLTQKEAQIMRSMVGSSGTSISKALLEAKSKKTVRPTLKGSNTSTNSQQNATQDKAGDTTITFSEGAIQISMANGSPSEIKRGAKQMFEEFKRMVELENMKNYKPARPRRV